MKELFKEPLGIINVGVPSFYEDMKKQGANAVNIRWTPPAGGNPALLAMLEKLETPLTDSANAEAVKRIMAASPVLVDIQKAIDIIPGMTPKTILHSGPPISYVDMCGAMKGAVMGALVYEGLANDLVEAEQLALSGEIRFSPCHEHGAVGPMAGIISASMPVHVVRNTTHGNTAFATINEGLGKVLRYGANGEDVINRLRFIEKVVGPAIKRAISKCPIDLKVITAQAIQMGDECHNRNKAATALLIRELTPYFMKDPNQDEARETLEFICANEHYFLNLSMAACKCSLDVAEGIEHSTILTAMARNGVEFGVRVSGLGGEWFTGPAQMVKGLLFPGFTEDDRCPDIGDSAITETMGIGGFSMAAAPAIVRFVGGTVEDALGYTSAMYGITETENTNYPIAAMNFRGCPTGIDVRKVIAAGVLPIINTGIAHKEPGIGQIGAGLVNPPAECFDKALAALAER